VAEFADVLKGTASGRASPEEVTIFDSVGFALEDYSALRYLHKLQLADAANRRRIDLVPYLDNPKDLFGLLAPAATRTVKAPRPDIVPEMAR
jgi:ornithine cyclodeaminase